jgi:hypothetical protein
LNGALQNLKWKEKEIASVRFLSVFFSFQFFVWIVIFEIYNSNTNMKKEVNTSQIKLIRIHVLKVVVIVSGRKNGRNTTSFFVFVLELKISNITIQIKFKEKKKLKEI